MINTMKYRNRTDILALMLQSASAFTVPKTKIMYKAYVPHEMMNDLLASLVDNGLLYYDPETRLYSTTAKGNRFLEYYRALHDCLKSDDEGIRKYDPKIANQYEAKSITLA
jgi:predicted transcriptional regulator